MTVNKYATQAGKKYETDLMKYLREQDFDVERLRLTGVEDEGDLVIRMEDGWTRRYILEAKRHRAIDLAGWVGQAEAERANYAAHRAGDTTLNRTGFVVVHHARGKGIGKSYVTTTLDEWLERL